MAITEHCLTWVGVVKGRVPYHFQLREGSTERWLHFQALSSSLWKEINHCNFWKMCLCFEEKSWEELFSQMDFLWSSKFKSFMKFSLFSHSFIFVCLDKKMKNLVWSCQFYYVQKAHSSWYILKSSFYVKVLHLRFFMLTFNNVRSIPKRLFCRKVFQIYVPDL